MQYKRCFYVMAFCSSYLLTSCGEDEQAIMIADLQGDLHQASSTIDSLNYQVDSVNLLLDEARGITFSSEDASHLAQAKAANYCGQLLLMRQFGVDASGIDRLYLAGGFANYIDVDNAMAIGFIVPVAADRVEKIGNAALQGAREVLIDRQRRTRLEQIVPQIDHVELETDPTFFDAFVDGCMFQPMLP